MSVTDNDGIVMPRNGEQVRLLLQEAALKLYSTRGYDVTTTAEIAAEAGVTERTFFRHFADKREVFFDGEGPLIALLSTAVDTAKGCAPLEILRVALQSVVPLVVSNRPFTEPRHKVIERVPALRERAMAKNAAVTAALATALVQRGMDSATATLAAQTAIAAFQYSIHRWATDDSIELHEQVDNAFSQLQLLTQSLEIKK